MQIQGVIAKMNFKEWSIATPEARRAAIREMKKAGLAEKRRLEREGLLPDYDYPDPKGTHRSSGQKRKPITVLNDNPGPCYYIDTPTRPGVSICGRPRDWNRTMLIDGDDLNTNVTNYNDGSHASSLPVATTAGWNENRLRKESVYQSTHNAQALTDKKIKPEKRIALKKRGLSPENGHKCEGTVDPTTVRLLPSVKCYPQNPGPGAYAPEHCRVALSH
ncbi:uncharacterized protein LOC124274293 [Haliotis rubra]|uniref:uncharacterized protein LOC124274293 n=1 Tax=Haliotis rubra TaxID=36100 RepID=UPI001EE5C0DC|nr:uncharacterized protein LOC124274293 [Haliotis rubra]